MSTDSATGLAGVVELKGIIEIKQIEIRRGSGPVAVIEFKDKEKNKWAVNFSRNTLRATNLIHAPCYE